MAETSQMELDLLQRRADASNFSSTDIAIGTPHAATAIFI